MHPDIADPAAINTTQDQDLQYTLNPHFSRNALTMVENDIRIVPN